MLQVLAEAQPPSTLSYLPFVWPEPLVAARAGPAEPPPISKLIAKKPWLLLDLLSGHIPDER
jgi:hypothetical protein